MNFLSVKTLLLVFVGFAGFCLAQGFVQQLVLYESETEDKIVQVINQHVPDTAIYDIQKVRRYCYRGMWDLFFGTDYTYRAHSFAAPTTTCANASFLYKSVRFEGGSDTDQDALSLFTAYLWIGDEIYVDQLTRQIPAPVKSLAYTGTSSWTLFEKANMEGPTVCINPPPFPQRYNYFDNITANFGLLDIGSVAKGCAPNVNGEVLTPPFGKC